MQKIFVCLFALTVAAVVPAASYAQGTPSSKATAAINDLVTCRIAKAAVGEPLPVHSCASVFSGAPVVVTDDNFVPIMNATVKVSNSQSLFVSPSLVTGLYTQTKTRTADGSTSTAIAEGGVYLRAVLKDSTGQVVRIGAPVSECAAGVLGCYQNNAGQYGVTLDARVQTLTQEISECLVTVDGSAGTCDFTSTIDLALKTTSAHTFNFIFPNVGQGVYQVEIQGAVNASASVSAGFGSATGAAAWGLGAVTIESVRLVHGFEF